MQKTKVMKKHVSITKAKDREFVQFSLGGANYGGQISTQKGFINVVTKLDRENKISRENIVHLLNELLTLYLTEIGGFLECLRYAYNQLPHYEFKFPTKNGDSAFIIEYGDCWYSFNMIIDSGDHVIVSNYFMYYYEAIEFINFMVSTKMISPATEHRLFERADKLFSTKKTKLEVMN